MKGSGRKSCSSKPTVRFDDDAVFTLAVDHHNNEMTSGAGNRYYKVPDTPRCISRGYFDRVEQTLFYPKALNGEFLSTLISKEFFEMHFPDSRFKYESLIEAANDYPKSRFGMPIDVAQMKRETAAFLAHIDHATNGLTFIDNSTPESPYCQDNEDYPCVSGKSYHPRGPMKMCWNYNYGPCGVAIGEDLLSYPEKVSQDPAVAFKSAIWCWCTKHWNKPSCHEVMMGLWESTETDIAAQRLPGFGLTTNIINGGKECGKISEEAESRLRRYKKFCADFGVDPGENLSTQNQTPFGYNG